jgi:hypothetical protein
LRKAEGEKDLPQYGDNLRAFALNRCELLGSDRPHLTPRSLNLSHRH